MAVGWGVGGWEEEDWWLEGRGMEYGCGMGSWRLGGRGLVAEGVEGWSMAVGWGVGGWKMEGWWLKSRGKEHGCWMGCRLLGGGRLLA
jgi:hypothetical protein